ncbi:hypothetical protein ElP_58020 [Tautonia plasticadhaerens]|uniref:Glycosyltransferase RgtA/B/C/D-like domain-containing protein n=1 Tax=Tautonia plasticadhaerens TaxID=2527974 RepID=A0A518HAH2_9BACT|nr:hypothetical protein ElP_58020 [Tautonia plasticadhaerens]
MRGFGPDPDGHDEPGRTTAGRKRDWRRLARVAGIAAAFSALGVASSVLRAPDRMFLRFVAMDSGAELAIQDLIGRGSRPGVDFGYPYGLLPLLAGRLWYGLLGRSPGAFHGLTLAFLALSCWGLARFATARGVGLAGLVLIALAMPDLSYVTGLTSTHVLEQALLVLALAEQARGKRGSALALLAACCFVKPSLAFVQGFVVLIAAASASRVNRTALSRVIALPAITAFALGAILALAFGPRSLARTISPATGASIYRLNDFGFFHGRGRDFWNLPDAGPFDYFRYEVGFWMLGTAILAGGGLAAGLRLARRVEGAEAARDDELVATCAAVHLAFVTLLFGHRVTWVYSLPMLVLGLALLANRGPRHRLLVWALAGLLLVNDRSKLIAARMLREELAPSPSTRDLWASPREREEWARALELSRGERPVLLAMSEGGAVLFPGFAPPTVAYLYPGCPTPEEVRRKAEQLSGARVVISFYPPDWEGFALWPRIGDALDGLEPVFEGQALRVYRRGHPGQLGPAGPTPPAP